MKQYYTGVGSRSTPIEICKTMTELAREKSNLNWILRSGAAVGADAAFEAGAGDNKEIWLPWLNFNGHSSKNLPSHEAIKLVYKFHPAPDRLNSSTLLLHARNIHQILGRDLKSPSKELICWTPDGRFCGGTATALRVAEHYNIPIINLGKR